ncbi:MAG TPA: CHAD domain-containing protein, partial [Bacteroidia bacterium]|nr:CHAD domain-containing protein [Bacteroidia bacterium]
MKHLNKYVNKRFSILKSNLKKYKNKPKPEQLHQVRVELKKVKTIFKLLACNSKQFSFSSSYKPLKHIFKKAGHIREWDVLHQLFEHYKLQEFEENIIPSPKERKSEITKFHKKTKQYILTVKQIHKKTKGFFKKVNKQDL